MLYADTLTVEQHVLEYMLLSSVHYSYLSVTLLCVLSSSSAIFRLEGLDYWVIKCHN